jgi:hypothetical protein
MASLMATQQICDLLYIPLRKDGQFALPVLHLWHRESDRGQEAGNMQRLEARIHNRQVRTETGLDKYTKAKL